MDSNTVLIWIFFNFISTVLTQTVPDARRCVANSGVTAFPACQYVYDDFSTCSAYAAASSAYAYFNCFCQQKYFNALFDCNSEERLCLGTGEQVDPHLSNQVSVWHSECDDKINYTPTTPIISSITASYNIDYCNTAKLNCASLTIGRESCTETYSQGQAASLTSCLCRPQLLTLAYDCSILGNVSCIQVPAALTNMAEYGHCTNLDTILTISASVTSTLGTGTTIRYTYYTPTSTSNSSPVSTARPVSTASPLSTASPVSTASPSYNIADQHGKKVSVINLLIPWLIGSTMKMLPAMIR